MLARQSTSETTHAVVKMVNTAVFSIARCVFARRAEPINLSVGTERERAPKWQRAREMTISKETERKREREGEREGELVESAEAHLTQGLSCLVRLPSLSDMTN